MPQVVEPAPREPGTREQPLKLPCHVGFLERKPDRRREKEPLRRTLPGSTTDHAFLKLARPVRPQGRSRYRRQCDRPT